jgi:uncharacterized protein
MKFPMIILAIFCAAGSALAQVTPSTTPSKPTPQHQPGTPASSATSTRPATKDANPDGTASAEKVDPAKEAAIRHLMDITDTSKLGDNIATFITGQVHDGIGRALTPDALAKFMETFSQKFSAANPSAAVTDEMIPIYAHAFSMEDIQGLIHFYESPLGQHVVKTLPDVVQQSQTAGLALEKDAALRILRGMEDQYPELKQVLPPEDATAPGGATAPGKTPSSQTSPPSTAPKTVPAPNAAPATPQK